MRIAGIYPQKIEIDPKIQHAVSEPYGLEMILAVAKQDGHDVNLFVPEDNEEAFVEKIMGFEPDIAAFSVYTCQYPMAKKIAEELKRRNPKIMNVAGNRYPSFLGEKIEEPFDFFVIKEGEETFKELLREIQGKQEYEKVRGISFKKNGKVVFTGVRERNLNLDSLLNALRFPVILNQIYRGISIPPLSSNPHYTIVEASRCCYNACKFCDNEGFWGNQVVFRSKERVIDEMFELKEKGVDIFYFMDLNFTAFPEKTRQLCEEMLSRKLDTSWYCMNNVATVDSDEGSELLRLMKEAGCFKIAWGVESTNDAALERMNKRVGRNFTTNEQTIRVLESALDVGLINQGFYIIGFPWETPDSILRDAESLNYIPMHLLNIGIFTPIPLSRFYSKMIREGYAVDQNLEHHDRNHLIFNHRNLTELTGNAEDDIRRGDRVIKSLQQKIYDDFYSNPEYLTRLKRSCEIEPGFVKAFNDYFEFLGKNIRVELQEVRV